MPFPPISACFYNDCFFFLIFLVFDKPFVAGWLTAPVPSPVFEFTAPVLFAFV